MQSSISLCIDTFHVQVTQKIHFSFEEHYHMYWMFTQIERYPLVGWNDKKNLWTHLKLITVKLLQAMIRALNTVVLVIIYVLSSHVQQPQDALHTHNNKPSLTFKFCSKYQSHPWMLFSTCHLYAWSSTKFMETQFSESN